MTAAAERARRVRSAITAIAIVAAPTTWQAVMAVSGLKWYSGLVKPSFSPAPPVAAALSAALAITLAAAFFRILCRPDYLPDRPASIRLFLVALGLDAVWSWLFFAGRHPTAALLAATGLAMLVPTTAWRFATVDRRAGLLLIPWALASVFTALLDLSIALRNG